MDKKIQYIHCPCCNGIIEMEPESLHHFSSSIRFPNMPRCKECGRKYNITIETERTFKIIISEI